jgi:hypothetical protein
MLLGQDSFRAVAAVAVSLFNRAYSIGDLVAVRGLDGGKAVECLLTKAAWLGDAGAPVCGAEGFDQPVECGLITHAAPVISPAKKRKAAQPKPVGQLF